MKGLEGLELLNGVNDEFVASCAETNKKRRTPAKYLFPIAAGFLLALAAVFIIKGIHANRPSGEQQAALPGDNTAEPSVTPVSTEPSVTPDSRPAPLRNDPDPFLDLSRYGRTDANIGIVDGQFSYPNYFVYRGKVFSFYMYFNLIYPGDPFGWIGNKVVDISRNPLLPDYPDGELIPEPNYIAYEILQELTGSFDGAVYELKGYDPEYVLCRPTQGGEMQIYFTGSGAVTGADILENRFHLRERMDSFIYEYAVHGKAGDELSRNLDPEVYGPAILKLFDALDSAEWEENTRGDFSEVYHLHILLNDGMRIELELIDNGMVYFADATRSAMLRIDTEAISELISLMRSGSGEVTVLPEYDLERQLDFCRNFVGAGSVVPDFIPNGFEIASISPEFMENAEHMPESISRINVTYQLIDKWPFIGLDVMTKEYFDSISWAGIERVVPAGEFSADDFSRSVLEKDGSEYWISGAVEYNGYVIVVTSNYIIDSESGSQQGLEALVSSMTELLQSVGR